MSKLQSIEEVAEAVMDCVYTWPNGEIDREYGEAEAIIKKRDQAIKEALLEGVEGNKIYEKGYISLSDGREMAVNSDRCIAYNQALDDIKDIINKVLD